MNENNERLTCEQAKQIDIVNYLASLGYQPAKIRNNDYWYLSPLRTEKTPSFKVNRKQNVWYDHGTGRGGTLIDLGILYHNCSIKELLEKLSGPSFLSPELRQVTIPEKPTEKLINILSHQPLNSLYLLRYLTQRRIDLAIAKKHCSEVIFSLNDKTWSAIGFRNNEGGFELRNQWFKGSSSPKTITSIQNGANTLSVFEGFFDFLSYKTIHQNQPLPFTDFLILNSVSFFEKSRVLMEKHDHIHLFLHRDKTGQNCTVKALSWSKKYKDESQLYNGYKDLNEWAQQVGKTQRQGVQNSIK